MRLPFKLQYISDLHLEKLRKIPYHTLQPSTNNIALLGDIGDPFTSIYYDLLKHVSTNFDKVILLSGNHEYWNRTIKETDNQINYLVNKFHNITYLNNTKTKIDSYDIIGSTLWSNVIDDPNNNTVIQNKFFHYHSMKEIDKLLTDKPTIMLTHYLPSYQLIHPDFVHYPMYYKSRYASDLDHMCKDNVKAWLYGHSHKHVGMFINNTYCSSNPFYDFNNRVLEII